jgi:hypothetical protein
MAIAYTTTTTKTVPPIDTVDTTIHPTWRGNK